MKKVAIFLLTLLVFCQVAAGMEFTGSYADVKAKSASLDKPILMDFYAEW